jgi:hypothetical protein
MGFWDKDDDDETVERHRGNPAGFEGAMREQAKHQGKKGCAIVTLALFGLPAAVLGAVIAYY